MEIVQIKVPKRWRTKRTEEEQERYTQMLLDAQEEVYWTDADGFQVIYVTNKEFEDERN